MASNVDVQSATLKITCNCGAVFVATVDKEGDTDYVQCPRCKDTAWIGIEAEEHWCDPREVPADKDMIAMGVLVTEVRGG